MGLSISISPVVTGVIIIVVTNFFLSLGKSNVMKKSYIIISAMLSFIGLLGIILIRSHLVASLSKKLSVTSFLDSDFIPWAIKKFDFFAAISISATWIVIIFLCYLLFTNKKDSIVLSNFSSFVNIFRLIIFLFSIWYSIGTVNKFFDLGSYIGTLAIFEIFVLYIPLIIKRWLLLKNENF